MSNVPDSEHSDDPLQLQLMFFALVQAAERVIQAAGGSFSALSNDVGWGKGFDVGWGKGFDVGWGTGFDVGWGVGFDFDIEAGFNFVLWFD